MAAFYQVLDYRKRKVKCERSVAITKLVALYNKLVQGLIQMAHSNPADRYAQS